MSRRRHVAAARDCLSRIRREIRRHHVTQDSAIRIRFTLRLIRHVTPRQLRGHTIDVIIIILIVTPRHTRVSVRIRFATSRQPPRHDTRLVRHAPRHSLYRISLEGPLIIVATPELIINTAAASRRHGMLERVRQPHAENTEYHILPSFEFTRPQSRHWHARWMPPLATAIEPPPPPTVTGIYRRFRRRAWTSD